MLVAVGQRIPHEVFENIFFDQLRISFGSLEHICMIREMLQCIQVGVQFVIEAAFQTTALTTQFGLIDAEVLVAALS